MQTDKLKTLLAAATVGSAVAFSGAALATPTITISSPGDASIVIEDGGTGDLSGIVGRILFEVEIGGVSLVGNAAQTKPRIGTDSQPRMDIAFDVTSDAADEVTLTFSETGFLNTGDIVFNSSIGGTTDGQVSFDSYVDDSNALNGMAVKVGSGGPFGSFSTDVEFSGGDSGVATVAAPFSITQQMTVVHNAASTTRLTTGDFGVSVPEPATVMLLGAGLLGIGAATRRRRTQA